MVSIINIPDGDTNWGDAMRANLNALNTRLEETYTKASTASQPGHTHPAAQISDSTAVGRSVLTAADQATARNALAVPSWSNQVIAGTGLTGGGDLTTNRTLALSAATLASLAKADTASQPGHTHVAADITNGTATWAAVGRAIAAGTGLTGGGTLVSDRTIALSAATIASLAKADTAVQPAGIADITSGRLAAIAQRIPNGGDVNAYTDNGWYRGLGLTNAPNVYWNLYSVIKHAEGNADDPYVYQRAVTYAGDAASVGFEYVRIRQGGTWGAWRQVADGTGPIDASARTTASNAIPKSVAAAGQLVYNNNGTFAGVPFGTGATAGAVVQRNSSGQVTVPSPSSTSDATSKAYVDAQVLAKYTKPSTGIPDSDLASKFVKTINGTAPDANGNVAVTGGGGVAPVTSVAGRQGDVTLTKSDVGLSNVDNTSDANKPVSTAQASAISAKYTKPAAGIPESDLAANVPMITAVKAALAGTPMVAEGHSFVVGQGVSSPNKWAEQFASMFGMTYPTLNTTGDLMRAVGGSSVEEIAQRALVPGTQYTWNRGDHYPLLLECLINTSRRTGQNAAARTGAEHAVRSLVAVAGSSGYIPASDSRFTYTSGWNTASVGTSMSQTVYTMPTSAAATVNVTFTMPAPQVWVLVLSRNASVAGNTVKIYNRATKTTLVSFDNTNTSAADTPNTYVSIPLKVKASVGDIIEISSPTRAGTFAFDGLLIADPNPAPVFLMKEPYLADYSLSTSYPLGSDAVFDYFNTIMDTMEREFPNVVVADPNTAGYWNKNTMLQSDGVHPNAAGSTALAQTMRDAVLAKMPAVLAKRALGLYV